MGNDGTIIAGRVYALQANTGTLTNVSHALQDKYGIFHWINALVLRVKIGAAFLALPALVEESGIPQLTLANVRLASIGMAHNASAVLKVNIGTEIAAFPAQGAKFGRLLLFPVSVNKDINGMAQIASFLAPMGKYQSMECVNVLQELI